MRLKHLLAATPLLAVCLCAHADTISTFSIQGAAVTYGMAGDFNTVAGTTTIDTTTGEVESLAFDAGGVAQSGVNFEDKTFLLVGSTDARFTFSGVTLVGFTGDNFNLNGPNDLYVGQVSLLSTTASDPTVGMPAAVTPEPESVFLLATGLLGMAGLLRRRGLAAGVPA